MRLLTLLCLLSLGFSVAAQTPVPPSTAYTRDLLRATNALQARAKLGVLSTNATSILLPDGVTVTTNADGSFSVSTNKLFIRGGTNDAISSSVLKRYDVRDFGAACDLRGLIATVAAGSSTVTTTNDVFSASDVGKVLSIYLAGTNQCNLSGVISAVNSSSNVTIAAVAGAGATNKMAVCFTDDGAALQRAFNQLTNSWGCEVLVSGPMGTTQKLLVPPIWRTNSGRLKPTFRLIGQLHERTQEHELSFANVRGSSLWFMAPRATTTNESFIGTENRVQPIFSSSGSIESPYVTPFNAVHVEVEDISIFHAWNQDMTIVDLRGALSSSVRQTVISSLLHPNEIPKTNNAYAYTGTNGYALRSPGYFADPMVRVDDVEIKGSRYGIHFSENIFATEVKIHSCEWPLVGQGTAGLSVFWGMDVQNCNGLIKGEAFRLNIDARGVLMANNTTYTNTFLLVDDPSGSLLGEIEVTAQEYFGNRPMPAHYNPQVLQIRQKKYSGTGYTSRSPERIQSGVLTGSLWIGADRGTNTLELNADKYGSITAPSYTATNWLGLSEGGAFNSRFTPISWFSSTVFPNLVNIGGDVSAQMAGANDVRIWTTSVFGAVPTNQWHWNGNGDYLPYGSQTIGALNAAVARAYITNVTFGNGYYARSLSSGGTELLGFGNGAGQDWLYHYRNTGALYLPLWTLRGGYQGGGESAVHMDYGVTVGQGLNITNSTMPTALAAATQISLWNSNGVLYAVSTTKTNLISDLR